MAGISVDVLVSVVCSHVGISREIRKIFMSISALALALSAMIMMIASYNYTAVHRQFSICTNNASDISRDRYHGTDQ